MSFNTWIQETVDSLPESFTVDITTAFTYSHTQTA